MIAAASSSDKPTVIVCQHDPTVQSDIFIERIITFLNIGFLNLIFQPSEVSY